MAKKDFVVRLGGQMSMEVAMALPFFMMLAFAILQLGHLSIGIAIVNYAASSVARQAVAQNGFNQSDAEAKFKNLLVAGLQYKKIEGIPTPDGGDGTTNIKVTACVELPTFPLVGDLLRKSLFTDPAPPDSCDTQAKWRGPIGIKGSSPYHFVIEGQAVARMNYNYGK